MAFLMERALLGLVLVFTLLANDGWSLGIGDRAPDHAITDWHGNTVRLGDLRGQTVCVDFWASWCAACAAALPEFDALARRHRGAAVRFLAVNVDRDFARASSFLERHLPSPASTLLRDPGGELLLRFGAPAMPSVYLIDGSGVVRMLASGYDEKAITEIERTLDELLDGGEHVDRPP